VNWVNSGNGFGRYDSTLKIVEVLLLLLLLLKSSPEQFSTTLPQTAFRDIFLTLLFFGQFPDITMTAVKLCFQCFDAVGWAAGRASSL